jgi:hypothetical protein
MGLGLTTLVIILAAEALLGAGLLWFAFAPVGWQLRLVCGGLWLLPYVVTVFLWRWLLDGATHRAVAHLVTVQAALFFFFPFALLGAAGWLA